MIKRRFPQFLLAFASLALTAFAFLNTYEVVFNKDIAFADSIHKITAQDQIRAIVDQFNLKPEAGRALSNSAYRNLEQIQIPSLGANLYLEEERLINGNWYARPSMGHVVPLNKDDHGVTIDYLIYSIASWRSLPAPNQIEEGMTVNLFHDGRAVSTFKVAEKQALPLDKTFVASKSDKRQIILFIEDPEHAVYYGFSLTVKE
jgi:hypothetical protein